MSEFKWTDNKAKSARMLALGHTEAETSEAVGVTDRTIRRWKKNEEFSAEVDRLSLMLGIAARAERLRLAMRVVRQRTQNDYVATDKDLLDWLKFAQSETDGVKLDLTSLLEAQT